MRKLIISPILVALFLTLVMPEESRATSCEPRKYSEHIKFAEWVFVGTVTEAKAMRENSHSISFVMSEIDALRGEPPANLALETGRGAYDPKITIGERYIVFLNSTHRKVGFCSGFKQYVPSEYLNVLLMRGMGDCGTDYDREIAVVFSRQKFFREGGPYTRQQIDELLNHYLQINPNLKIRSGANRITVKGVDFVFADDYLSVIEMGKCAT